MAFTPPELSSNPSLASILIPAHARSQAAASTPTNPSSTTGQSLSQELNLSYVTNFVNLCRICRQKKLKMTDIVYHFSLIHEVVLNATGRTPIYWGMCRIFYIQHI